MTNGTASKTNGSDLLRCPHCGSVAEYVSEHAKGKRWAVSCTMTSKVAADEGKPMCRCRTPFVRDKGQARDIWNRRAAVTDYDFAMAVHDGELWGKCSECKERQGYYLDAETIQRQQERIAELEAENRRMSADLYATTGANDKLEDLAIDLYCQLLNAYDAKELDGFAERMREIGIEVKP